MGSGRVLADTAGTLVAVMLCIACAGMGLDGLSALYTAYTHACMRLDDEKWLLQNCRDPVFFSKMRAHTTVCSDVEANARVGAFWVALREVTEGFKVTREPWSVVCVVLLLMLLLPAFWVCAVRAAALGVSRYHFRRIGGGHDQHRFIPRYDELCCKEL